MHIYMVATHSLPDAATSHYRGDTQHGAAIHGGIVLFMLMILGRLMHATRPIQSEEAATTAARHGYTLDTNLCQWLHLGLLLCSPSLWVRGTLLIFAGVIVGTSNFFLDDPSTYFCESTRRRHRRPLLLTFSKYCQYRATLTISDICHICLYSARRCIQSFSQRSRRRNKAIPARVIGKRRHRQPRCHGGFI